MSEINLKEIVEEAIDYRYLEEKYCNADRIVSCISVFPDGVGEDLVTLDVFKIWCLEVLDFNLENQLAKKITSIKKKYLKNTGNFYSLLYQISLELIINELIDSFWNQFRYCYDKTNVEDFVKKHYDYMFEQKLDACDSCFFEIEFLRDCLDAKKYIKIQNNQYKIIESGVLVAAFSPPFYD